MALDVEGYHALVDVRRIVASEDGTDFTFGVSFILLAPALQQKINRTVAQVRTPWSRRDAPRPW